MIRAGVLGAGVLRMLAVCGTAFGQQTPLLTSSEETGALFRADTRLVVCHTTVADHSGHLVTDLPQSAFSVAENGVRQQIKAVKREDVPVALGLVIDNSGSMTPKRAQVEAASLALVKASNPDDEVFVVNFNDEVYLDLPPGVEFTHDLNLLQQALKRIDSRGGTAMRDAIQMSVEHLKKARQDKKVIVVVTDGDDNYSGITLEELVKSPSRFLQSMLLRFYLREKHHIVFAIDFSAIRTGGIKIIEFFHDFGLRINILLHFFGPDADVFIRAFEDFGLKCA